MSDFRLYDNDMKNMTRYIFASYVNNNIQIPERLVVYVST